MSKERSCLNCKYEPEWGPVFAVEYPRRSGQCQKELNLDKMPVVFQWNVRSVILYSDNSQEPYAGNCQTWEAK